MLCLVYHRYSINTLLLILCYYILTKSCIYAIIVIDLTNFPMTNDNKGPQIPEFLKREQEVGTPTNKLPDPSQELPWEPFPQEWPKPPRKVLVAVLTSPGERIDLVTTALVY